MLDVRDFTEEKSIVFATAQGIVKRTLLSAFASPRRAGVVALAIDERDRLIAACLASEQVMLFTRLGMAVRFSTELVRNTGRGARGVRGVWLRDDDWVVACQVVDDPEKSVLIVCENGYGKRSAVKAFRQTQRGSKGVRSIVANERNGCVVGAVLVEEEDSVLLMGESGQTVRVRMSEVRRLQRSTQGVKLLSLKEGKIVAVC